MDSSRKIIIYPKHSYNTVELYASIVLLNLSVLIILDSISDGAHARSSWIRLVYGDPPRLTWIPQVCPLLALFLLFLLPLPISNGLAERHVGSTKFSHTWAARGDQEYLRMPRARIDKRPERPRRHI